MYKIVKYRATHGRGRGRGRGKGKGAEALVDTGEKGRRSLLHNLGSNEYRFTKLEDADDHEVADQVKYGDRVQYFASEQPFRDKRGTTSGEYFHSRTMKQWEEAFDVGDDNGESYGTLDLNWIASQLELVPPDIRYRMDPKFCIDLPFRPLEEDANQVEIDVDVNITTVTASGSALTPTQSKPKGDAELDFLLDLSKANMKETNAIPTISTPVVSGSAATKTSIETEQLEEWLDDVLDI